MTPRKRCHLLKKTLLILFLLSVIIKLSNVKEFYVNNYCFAYETTMSEIKELLYVKIQAKNLSSALKLFWNESKDYHFPVKRLSTYYVVTNSKGKCSSRFLKDNIKVYPDEN